MDNDDTQPTTNTDPGAHKLYAWDAIEDKPIYTHWMRCTCDIDHDHF